MNKKTNSKNTVTVNFAIPIDTYLEIEKKRFDLQKEELYPITRSKFIAAILKQFCGNDITINDLTNKSDD
jgi:hypothetical protein